MNSAPPVRGSEKSQKEAISLPPPPTTDDRGPVRVKQEEGLDKRNDAQDLLSRFMKDVEKVSSEPARKRSRGEEPEANGMHPARRRRFDIKSESDKRRYDVKSESDRGRFDVKRDSDKLLCPAPPANAAGYIKTGAGKFNSGKVPINSRSFSLPTWSGIAGEKYYFEVKAGKEIVNRFPIWTEKVLVFGRTPDCNVVVNHGLVSRRHCLILFSNVDGKPRIYDMGSTHGTFMKDLSSRPPVNDGLLPKKKFIKVDVGYKLMFAKCTYQYCLASSGINPNAPHRRQDTPPQRSYRRRSRSHHYQYSPRRVKREKSKSPEVEEDSSDEYGPDNPRPRGIARFLAFARKDKYVMKEFERFGKGQLGVKK